jgi:hypothetical protein
MLEYFIPGELAVCRKHGKISVVGFHFSSFAVLRTAENGCFSPGAPWREEIEYDH